MRSKAASEESDPQEAARRKCLRLLSTRARSKTELRRQLARSGFAEDVAEGVLVGLEQAGLVDDEEFAKSWVAERREARGLGRLRLRWELRQKGIGEELIRRYVDEETDEESEFERALAIAERRSGGSGEGKRPGRLQRLLVRRGFEAGVVEGVMRRIAGEDR